jgi:hypothetical protein
LEIQEAESRFPFDSFYFYALVLPFSRLRRIDISVALNLMGSRVVTAKPNAACSPEMDLFGKTGSKIPWAAQTFMAVEPEAFEFA